MGIELGALHYVYLVFIALIIVTMVMKRDTTIVCILGIFILGITATLSLPQAIMGIFNSFIYAITELLGTILIISIIFGMSELLMKTGINETMIRPVTKLIKNPALAYWIIGIIMMIISWFFWPSPAVALIGAVLLPVAIQAGLPALGVAIAMNLFGHGIALSGDFIIQGAPKLTAGGAGIEVSEVVNASVPLVFVMGVVTTVTAFILLMRDIKKGRLKAEPIEISTSSQSEEDKNLKETFPKVFKKIYAIIIPLLFIGDIAAMYFLKLQGGDATALIGGTVAFILIVVSFTAYRKKTAEKVTAALIDGLQFGFKIFGPVIPIAAFFYLGDSGFTAIFGEILPQGSNGIVNDLGVALARIVPVNTTAAAIATTGVGAITGLDGSGFSGISLAGSIAKLFSISLGKGIATLTALGQIAAIWVGGGTIIPWAVIPAAAVCGVDAFELARRNIKPVIIGLVVTVIVGIILL